MRRQPWESLVRFCLLLPAAAGCGGPAKPAPPRDSEQPTVRLIRPERRTIVRVVGQPGFIDAYEQTAIYPKMTAYLQEWKVDIGDRVQQGQVLGTLFVPELVEEHRARQADLTLAREMIQQAEKMVRVADASVQATIARVSAAKASVERYRADVDRWESEVERLTNLVRQKVVDRQILDETTRQLRSSTAAREEAEADILTAQADQAAAEASLEKAKVDVVVARAKAGVAEAELKRVAALVGYLELTAPYNGIIVARNANRGDFVLPATGDPSASRRSRDRSSTEAAPIFVVARTDLLRVYIDVPEGDANYVKAGNQASVLVRAYRDAEIPARVTRTSWALDVKSRTLRAEIDLPNPDAAILPGMYAYGKVIIERPGVHALPLEALAYDGDRTFCWLDEDGRAVRAEIETGVSDGTWIEVTNHRRGTRNRAGAEPAWLPFQGTEAVILGDLSALVDGQAVQVAQRGSGGRSAGGK
jgi:HlyD family secretion protein